MASVREKCKVRLGSGPNEVDGGTLVGGDILWGIEWYRVLVGMVN